MARPRTRIALNVYLNARLVGYLTRQSSGAIEFRYADEWLAWEHNLPASLSLPLRDDRYTGAPVVAVFDNLLPDDEAIRRRLAARVKAEHHDAYSILAQAGRDCAGALQFLPEGMDPGPAGIIDARPLDDAEIATRLADLSANPLGFDEREEFRISLAGAQEKTALLFWKGKWHLPRGTTATTHILKPQIGRLPGGIDLSHSVENEYLCLKLASALGLPSAGVAIEDFAGHRVLVVERFDRAWTSDGRLLRVPQEDCCQALSTPPNRKYEADGGPGIGAVLDLLRGSDQPSGDRRLFLKAQILFWLLGATDGHAKNFSLFLKPGGRFRLTPLYDVLSTQPALTAGQLTKNKMKLAFAVGSRRHYRVDIIQPRHFVQTAQLHRIPSSVVEDALDEFIRDAEPAMDKVARELPADFPPALADSIFSGIRSRLRLIDGRGASRTP